MLNIIILAVGILFIIFLMKFYKEYKIEDKLPLLFMIPVFFMIYVVVRVMTHKLRFISSLSDSYMYLIILLIVLPVLYFISLKYLLKNRLFMYFRRQVQIYLHSFKRLDKKFLYNVLWSFALVLIFLGIILLFVLFMRNNLSPAISVLSPLMKAVQAEEDSTAGQQALIMLLAQNKELITETITKSVIGLVVTLVALLLVILMFGSVIWSNILRQKHGLLFLRRFAAVSFIWIILSLGVVSLALFLFKLKVGIVLGVILLLAFMYLKLGINLNFSKEKKILKNLGSFKKGFTRFHLMIIPFIFIFTTFVLLVISSLALLSLGNSVYRILIGIVLIFLLLSFVNWTRFYLVKVNSTDSQ